MKTSRLPLLAIVTLLVVIGAIVVSQQEAPQTSLDRPLLFPDIKDKINSLAEIKLTSGEHSLSLIKQGEKWLLEDADNYPANFYKIKETAVALTDLRILAEKTNKKELYAKLGVEAPQDEDSKSTLLTLKDDKQNELVSLIIGNTRQAPSPQAKPAFYARLPESGPALLVEGKLDISLDNNDWFQRDLLDVAADRIRSVHIKHDENAFVQIQRDKQDDEFTLLNITEGRTADGTAIGRIPSLLESIYIDDVKADSKLTFPESAIVTTIETFDGLVAIVTSAAVEDDNYIKLNFSYKEIPAKADAEQPESEATETESKVSEVKDVKQEVENLNKLVTNWVYQIPSYKFDLFRKKTEDLLEEIDSEDSE